MLEQPQACSNLRPGSGAHGLGPVLALAGAEHGGEGARGLGVCTGEIGGDSLAKWSSLVAFPKHYQQLPEVWRSQPS